MPFYLVLTRISNSEPPDLGLAAPPFLGVYSEFGGNTGGAALVLYQESDAEGGKAWGAFGWSEASTLLSLWIYLMEPTQLSWNSPRAAHLTLTSKLLSLVIKRTYPIKTKAHKTKSAIHMGMWEDQEIERVHIGSNTQSEMQQHHLAAAPLNQVKVGV